MNPTIEFLRDELRQKIDADPGLADCGILDLALPSIRLTTRRVTQDQLKLGESRIGGWPDVPPGFEWPRWSPPPTVLDIYGDDRPFGFSSPHGFIAQLDMSTLPEIDEAIPRTGWLCFFYDGLFVAWGSEPDDRGSCRVIYFDVERSSLIRERLPKDATPAHESSPCALQIDVELTLPNDTSGCSPRMPVFEAYQELQFQIHHKRAYENHHLLGHPQPVQSCDMVTDCQLFSNGFRRRRNLTKEETVKLLGKDKEEWRLLLQIDTDRNGPGWMWEDSGTIYFWIKTQDLANRRFNDVWLILQCC